MLNRQIVIACICLIFTSCVTIKTPQTSQAVERLSLKTMAGGSSGMTKISENQFIAVYDLKNFEDGTRIALINSYPDSFNVMPIQVSDWGDPLGRSSDLESICSIPGRENEFLAAESGNWQGKFGRIFHLKLNSSARSATVLGVFSLPQHFINDIGKVGDQNEGMLCVQNPQGELILYLAERGGSQAYASGLLTWCSLDFETYQLKYSTKGKGGLLVSAPGNWFDINTKRDMTDLYLDSEQNLWTSASQDQGDAGPFYSTIYKIGSFSISQDSILVFESEIRLEKEIPGFKIEALASPVSHIQGSRFSIGTEDEFYGGVWRSIY